MELDETTAPAAAEPAPELGPGEVHIPAAPIEDEIVDHCDAVVESNNPDPNVEEQKPLCQAVILKDAGEIPGGEYTERQIERKFEKVEAEVSP